MILVEKISFDIPVLWDALIFDEYVDKGKCENRTDFLLQIIKEKFDRDGVRYTPVSSKTYKTVEEIPLTEERKTKEV